MRRLGVLVLVIFMLGMFSSCTSCQTDSTTQTDTTTADTTADITDDTAADTTDDTTADTTTPPPTLAPPIAVTSPNGGENWVIGTTQTITWTSNYFGYVHCQERILLSRDGGASWNTIIHYTPNDGNQVWTVTGPATTRAKIKVWEQDTPVFDVSDANFTIAPP